MSYIPVPFCSRVASVVQCCGSCKTRVSTLLSLLLLSRLPLSQPSGFLGKDRSCLP